jgi:hypothetical protein
MECGFWFWFIRPVAEMAGVLAFVAIIAALFGLVYWLLGRNPRGK